MEENLRGVELGFYSDAVETALYFLRGLRLLLLFRRLILIIFFIIRLILVIFRFTTSDVPDDLVRSRSHHHLRRFQTINRSTKIIISSSIDAADGRGRIIQRTTSTRSLIVLRAVR